MLNNNRLNASLPAAWRSMTKIRYLALSSNRLEGTLPNDYSALTLLDFLSLANNTVSGMCVPMVVSTVLLTGLLTG